MQFARAFTVAQWYKDVCVELDRVQREMDKYVRDGDGDISTKMAKVRRS